MLSKPILYYGKDEPLPKQVALRAGPLSLVYEDGDLRYIKLGDREILRRIYVAIRDRNWGTVLPVFSNLQIEQGDASFCISYDVENRRDEIDFVWHGTISGEADGTISFAMDGVARSTFMRNRIGFCVLHPAECAGAHLVVEHVDGTPADGTFPVYIVAAQPVPPLAEMRAVRHEVRPGVWAEVGFSGDIFETEDQRNWTDASYKTFCTPLRLPFPVEVAAGTRIQQQITLRLRYDQVPAGAGIPSGPVPQELTVTLDMSRPPSPLPALGLGMASHDGPLSDREAEHLRALRLGHLRVDLRPAEPAYRQRLHAANQQSRSLGMPLEVALFLSEDADRELDGLLAALNEERPEIARWLVYPARELFGGGSPTTAVVNAAAPRLRAYDQNIPLASGTNSDFILVQRTLPPLDLIDALAFHISPQVHAFDNASMTEALAAQAMAVASARHLAGGLPVIVSPVTLKPRFNPVATGAIPPTPPGHLPPQVDPRQMSLFGAGWTLGSIKYLAEAGAESVTYYETTGWRGVMETEAGSPLPDRFPSLPGSVFPLYHVLADAGEFAGGAALAATSADPLHVECVALHKGNSRALLVANMTGQTQSVRVQGVPGPARLRRLDETNATDAMLQPASFRAQRTELRANDNAGMLLELLPYGVARIDW